MCIPCSTLLAFFLFCVQEDWASLLDAVHINIYTAYNLCGSINLGLHSKPSTSKSGINVIGSNMFLICLLDHHPWSSWEYRMQ